MGDIGCSTATVQVERVRFRAKLQATGEQLLVSGMLAQIGNKWVDRFVPKTTPVDIAASVVARVAVYRDSLPLPWEQFIQSPLKEIAPLLQTCEVAGCECQKWHGTSDPGQPPSILETWSRQYFSPSFKIVQPSAATVFNIMLRVPCQLESPLQAYSGMSGVFFEPRSDTQKSPSERFTVIWLPKLGYQQARLLMQTHPEIVGLGGVGDRFGVRCECSSAEALHGKLRPATAWLDKTRLRTFESGPWPFGTQRPAILKALIAFGWPRARPAQPCPGKHGGLWFLIEAEDPPPMQSLHASFGEVLFSEVHQRTPPVSAPIPVFGSQRALKGLLTARVGSSVAGDPIQASDPWQAALHRRAQATASSASGAPQADVARAIEQSVCQKLRHTTLEHPSREEFEAAICQSGLQVG